MDDLMSSGYDLLHRVCVPLQDSPDQGVLYLLRGLLNVLQTYPWETHSDTKYLLFLNVLCMLSASSQEIFIHHIDKGDTYF